MLFGRTPTGNLLAGPVGLDDLSPPVAPEKALQDMGGRRVRRLRRVVWDLFLGRVRWVPLVLPDNPLAGMERTADRLCSDS